jgi:hypothetical protein
MTGEVALLESHAPSGPPGQNAGAPSLAQARSAGLLPGYADFLAHAARLRGA